MDSQILAEFLTGGVELGEGAEQIDMGQNVYNFPKCLIFAKYSQAAFCF